MKSSWSKLLLGLLLGMMLMVPGAVSAPIQSQVGNNEWSVVNNRWTGRCTGLGWTDGNSLTGDVGGANCEVASSTVAPYTLNAAGTLDRVRGANTDGQAVTGIAASGGMLFNGTNWDRWKTASADSLGGASGTGIPTAGMMIFNLTTSSWDRIRSSSLAGAMTTATAVFDGTNWSSLRQASASTLTATTSTGIVLSVPASTWSVTNTPAAATQATASRASGGGTVRHVATTITACFSDTAAEPTATVNLRDGATGAGTVLRTWLIGISAANDSKCVDLSGMAMIGTAATAMTLEFAAAGSAASVQTVTLTGFSVP